MIVRAESFELEMAAADDLGDSSIIEQSMGVAQLHAWPCENI